MQGIELRHLRCLVALAEEGSFSRAAARLGTTQPAVSQLLKRLEDMVGQRLVHRDRLSLSLTALGEEVLLQAREALAAVDGALEATRRSLRGEAGRLRVGLSVPSLYGGVPALIRRLRAARPGVAVEMTVLPSTEQPAALLERRVDLAFGCADLRADGLARRVLADEAMQVVLPAWHRLAGRPSLPLAALREEGWIMPPAPVPLRDEILGAFRAAGYAPRIVAESTDFLTTFGLVMADAGLALAAESFADFAGPDLVLVPLTGPAPRLVHALAHRQDDRSPVLRALLEML
ncbi:LysR family transcriptional regulator [Pseudoroseomonas deserti]|uniref:LysR family transcriptional regulator n=1 Tax=Teichococcus deserti TaxID=1817963 RepID=A0A1V2H650_9PROT|nr:LysR family transcriptional regulator [Pseudoroseomonas deserti]ONG56389.1 LysR family transcriptional regulator [Pseudoroseomonas deserti]